MNQSKIISDMKLYLFDMDGTLYIGNRLFPFTKELLEQIRLRGCQYIFMTNNSSKSVEDYIAKLASFGISTTRDDFLTSSQATAYYLEKHHKGKTLYVCGTQSLKKELSAQGFAVSDDISKTECIVMGFDTELTFQKLEDACILLGRGVDYIATNPDYVCPTWYGYVPDCGSVSDMLYNATKRRPYFIGKPQPDMVNMAVEKTGFTKEQAVMMGDRLYTDIACGVNAGISTIFVLSGEGTMEDVAKNEAKPQFIFNNIKEVYKTLCE